MKGTTKMCPPLNYSFTVQGKFSSNYLTWLEIRVSRCGSLYNNSVPCANQSTFDAAFALSG